MVEADESDGTFLSLDPGDRRGHQRRARPSRPLRDLRRAGGGLRRRSWPAPAAGAWWGPTTRWPPLGPAPRRRRGGHGARVPPTGSSTSSSARSSVVLRPGRPAGAELGRLAVPVPGLHNARNAAVATVAALAVGRPFDAAARALARFAGVARRFEFRGEAGGVHLRRRLRPPARPRSGPRWPRPATAAGGRVVAVFQPHRYSRTGGCRPAVRRRLRRRRRGGGHRRLRRRRGAGARGVGPARGRRRPPARPRTGRSSTCPAATELRRTSPGCSGPATCAAPSAPGT